MKISEEIKNIEVSKLSKSKWNPRENYGQIEELGDTIAQDGIINPLIVVERDGRYEVIVGERRRYAAEKLKMKTLPCRIAELSDKEIQMLIAIEEFQKEELNVIERAKLYSDMIRSGWTQEDLAARVGLDQSSISNILSVLRLPEEYKEDYAQLFSINDITVHAWKGTRRWKCKKCENVTEVKESSMKPNRCSSNSCTNTDLYFIGLKDVQFKQN